MKIKIKRLQDEYDCEDCGLSTAEGAEITIGNRVLLLRPVAHCYESQHWNEEDIYKRIIEELGHELESNNG